MSGNITSQFIFVVCQVGAEPALKKEIARNHPELRFAYSRPGFLTFKLADANQSAGPEFELNSVFARAYGISIGKVGSKNQPATDHERVKALTEKLKSIAFPGVALHVFEREQFLPGEEPIGYVRGAWADDARKVLEPALSGLCVNAPSSPGDFVFDLILVEQDEWWFGLHVHGRGRSAYPGGRPELELPAESPSRAYLKLEEGLLWSGVPIRSGDVAVEIGSAPGGASFALLKRGVRVTGIDPGKMDPVVMKNPGYRHLEKPVFYVERNELPAKVDWLLCDMNVDPKVAITSSDRLFQMLQDTVSGVLLTIKLNKWEMAADIPGMLDYLRKSGFVRVRARQLANNRQEIFIYGLTRKGVGRLAEERKA